MTNDRLCGAGEDGADAELGEPAEGGRCSRVARVEDQQTAALPCRALQGEELFQAQPILVVVDSEPRVLGAVELLGAVGCEPENVEVIVSVDLPKAAHGLLVPNNLNLCARRSKHTPERVDLLIDDGCRRWPDGDPAYGPVGVGSAQGSLDRPDDSRGPVRQ